MTLMTIILGALPLRLLRVNYGGAMYWAGCLLVGGALFATGQVLIAAAFATLALLIGIYSEAEKQYASTFSSGAVAVLATSGLLSASIAVWSDVTNTNLIQAVKNVAGTIVARAVEMNPQLEVKADVLAWQAPSFVVVVMILALGASLMWERRGRRWFGLAEAVTKPSNLLAFKVPAYFVWIAIASGAAALIQHEINWLQVLGMNLLNIIVSIYFMQGMAVIGQMFQTFKVSPFWQTLWYVLLFLQLFPLVSMIGFADFWFEFRERLKKKKSTHVPRAKFGSE
jgi:hypothetical protein